MNSNYKHRRVNFLSIAHFFFFFLFSLYAQNSSSQDTMMYKCFTQAGDGLAQRPIPNAQCGFNSQVYNNFFIKKESFIPQNSQTRPATVTKKMKIRFVVINPDPTASPQWNFLPADTPKIKQMVTWLNQHAASLDAPSKPSTICGSCHVTDQRIRFELTDIVFVTDPANYTVWSQNQVNYGDHKDTIMNIYLVVNKNFYAILNGDTVYAAGARVDYLGSDFASAGEVGSNYVIMANVYTQAYTKSTYSEPWHNFDYFILFETRRLFHELNHTLGLHHLYDDVTCNPADPEYLADIFSGNTITCLLDNNSSCDEYNPLSNCTNNTMSKLGWYISPMQLGQLHRNAYIKRAKSYLYPTEAPTDHPWLVSNNETWDFAIRMYQDIRVKPGATLTVKCEIQMPPNSRIVVEPGGKLVVDGGIVTSYHGRSTWKGIEVMGNMNQASSPQYQGSLEIKNGAIIENAAEAVWNFSFENGAQGGGIIKAENSFFYNNWRSVGLNGYENYSYGNVFTGTTNCSFKNMEFTVDEHAPFLETHNWINGHQFTSFDTKSGVLIENCRFKNEIPTNLQPQKDRGRAIHMAATGIMVSNSSFDDFHTAINSEGYAPIPTCVTYVYDNIFNGQTNSINLTAQAYGDLRGNKIYNMNGYNRTTPVGILLDHTLGSFVGCNNLVDGSGGNPGPGGKIGTVINNNSPHEAATLIRNKFINLTRATQTQKDNVKLSILCNRYENNDLALCVNPNSSIGFLQDQGNGCDPSLNFRAGNIFTNNGWDIRSYLDPTAIYTWDYYYFHSNSVLEQVPFNASGGNIALNGCFFGSATSDPNSQCNKLQTCLRYTSATGNEHGQLQVEYAKHITAGTKYSVDASLLRSEIIRGYNALDDMAGLQTFLQNENDDNANRMLIPLYIKTGNYSGALSIITHLAVSINERAAYNDYYSILIDLKQQGKDITMLDPQALQTIQTLAASGFEVSPYAKAILDWTDNEIWEHDIEEEPEDLLQRPLATVPVKMDNSKLYEATPNPAGITTTILVYIAKKDASGKPKLILSNLMGRELHAYNLVEGENRIEVTTGDLATGLYTYSFVLQGRIIQTNKLSVVK